MSRDNPFVSQSASSSMPHPGFQSASALVPGMATPSARMLPSSQNMPMPQNQSSYMPRIATPGRVSQPWSNPSEVFASMAPPIPASQSFFTAGFPDPGIHSHYGQTVAPHPYSYPGYMEPASYTLPAPDLSSEADQSNYKIFLRKRISEASSKWLTSRERQIGKFKESTLQLREREDKIYKNYVNRNELNEKMKKIQANQTSAEDELNSIMSDIRDLNSSLDQIDKFADNFQLREHDGVYLKAKWTEEKLSNSENKYTTIVKEINKRDEIEEHPVEEIFLSCLEQLERTFGQYEDMMKRASVLLAKLGKSQNH